MKMRIGGNPVDASDGNVIEVTNPYTGKVIDTVPAATKSDVTLAIDNAVKGQKQWAALTIRERAQIIRRYIQRIREQRDAIAKTLCAETGKPLKDAYGEVDELCYVFEGAVEVAKHQYGATMPRGTQPGYDDDLQVTVHEPLGVIVCIVPFNFPIALWAYKAGPALIAGNAIITKPASANPLAVTMASQLLAEVGIPGGACQCVTGSGAQVGDWLVDDNRIAQVNMTGGVKAGLSIAQTAAKYLTDYKFELGGNDPLIILADADLDLAVSESQDRTRNSGQCCSGSKRFLVHNSVKQQFVDRLVKEILEKVVMGDPMDPATTMGTLISEKAAKQVEEQIQLTVRQGARIVYGGKRDGAFLQPTVLMDVTGDMDIARDMEVFGPVYPIIGFDTVEEAIAIAENSCYGLGGGVITNNLNSAMQVANALKTGHVAINASGSFRAAELPFGGGKKCSGNSRECLSTVLDEVTQVKSIIFRYAMKKP